MGTSVVDAEAAAARLLEGWWMDAAQDGPLPIDPFKIALNLGISVHSARLPADLSGQITFFDDGEAVITINGADHVNRRRFTCAHEVGHYTRRDVAEHSNGFVDYRDTLAGLGTEPEEIYANQFAAALLMPAHIVSDFAHRGMRVEWMAQLLGTSTQAMQLRLRNLRLA
jgi:Zn-dependent peptidase ImmA (M78 family)